MKYIVEEIRGKLAPYLGEHAVHAQSAAHVPQTFLDRQFTRKIPSYNYEHLNLLVPIGL